MAREAIVHLVSGWATAEPGRPELALGALLAGWAVDHSGLGPHHALAQTAVRTASIPHGPGNVALLPATIAALHRRRPAALDRLDATLGAPLEAFAETLRERAGAAVPADPALLDRLVETAAAPDELDRWAARRSPGAPRDLPRRRAPVTRPRAQPSTPVASCGAPTGLDSGEPRCRR